MNVDNIPKMFSEFGRDEFADWLWNGLRSFYTSHPYDRINAFQHFSRRILQYESVDKGLAQIYEEYIPESKKLQFRQSIGDVLRRYANEKDTPIDAVRNLIYLITRIKADESLTALFPTICNGYLIERRPRILYDTITILRSRAPSEQAYETASDLIDWSGFKDDYLFEAIKVLVECKPSHVSRTLIKYEERLSLLFQDVDRNRGSDEWMAFSDAANEWVQFLLEYAPPTWLSEFWEEDAHSADQSWLFKLIYHNKVIPTEFIHDIIRDQYFVKYKKRKFKLMVSDKDYHTREYLEDVSIYDKSKQWSHRPNDKIYRGINRRIDIFFNPYRYAMQCSTT
jgi:hypothetical protein